MEHSAMVTYQNRQGHWIRCASRMRIPSLQFGCACSPRGCTAPLLSFLPPLFLIRFSQSTALVETAPRPQSGSKTKPKYQILQQNLVCLVEGEFLWSACTHELTSYIFTCKISRAKAWICFWTAHLPTVLVTPKPPVFLMICSISTHFMNKNPNLAS